MVLEIFFLIGPDRDDLQAANVKVTGTTQLGRKLQDGGMLAR